MNQKHYAIIMAGGIGTRFWPMSRSAFPKQFHDILGTGRTLIQETVERFTQFMPEENIYIVTNERYLSLVKQQLPMLKDDQILLEPVGRNTAPCIAYACYKIKKINPEAVFVVSPADHMIENKEKFQENILLGLNTCGEQDLIMTLGIRPTHPNTGYGYIQFIEDEKDRGYYKVKTFTEKPNLEVAKSFLESGEYVWNSGIFLFSTRTIDQAFQEFLPDMAESFEGLHEHYYTEQEQAQVNDVYVMCKSESIDFGIMEKASNVHVIPADFDWSDLGTWGAVYDKMERDENDNAIQGDAMLYDTKQNMIKLSNDKKLVVVDGLEDFIVIDTEDALLICRKENEQKIKQFVADIKAKKGEPYV